MVSSEFAAMLDHVILPELLKCYCPTQSPADMAHYEQLCKDFAAKIGVHWTQVHYPFFLSADNCHKHPWARMLLLQPRESEAQMTQLRGQAVRFAQDYGITDADRAVLPALRQHISASYTEQASQMDRTQPGAEQQLAALHARKRDALHRRPQQLWQEVVQMRSSQLQSQRGCTPVQLFWRMQAWQQPWMRTVQPEQWMPLAPCTPDIHQVVEHMVKNIKDAFKASLHSVRYSDGVNLFHASTYQRWIREAVASKGNGAAGLHAITGSCRRQPICCWIVAADAGADVFIVYRKRQRGSATFRARGQRIWHALGTGGGYCGDSMWK